MKRFKAFWATFLVLSMLIGIVPVSIGAASPAEVQANAISVSDEQTQETDSTGFTQTDDIQDISEPFMLPDIIDSTEAEERGYIGRITGDEPDLNTFIFKNADGTNTLRLFDHPVKYVDEKGVTKDISLRLERANDGSFVSTEHIVNTVFSKNLSDGIELEYEDVAVRLLPQASFDTSDTITTTVMPIASVSSDSKTVSYPIDSKTSYEYQLTYAGFKEDIVVSEYTGKTEYSFILQTNGLTLTKIQESYFLTDKNGEIKATIGDIIVFTADERNNTMGTMTHQTLKSDQLYAMTIHLDAEYLADENTMYPIRIDPTIEVKYTSSADVGAIEDVTINSQDTSAGASGSLYVGLRNTYGISRVLMRFPRLDLSQIRNANSITSAHIELRDLLCPNTATVVQCYPFTGNSWSESNVDWSTVLPNSYGSMMSSNAVSYNNGINNEIAHRYKFDILTAVRGWKNGTYAQSKGIIFKSSQESVTKNATFASFNRATNRPSLIIEYTVLENVGNININSSMAVSITSTGVKKLFSFVPETTGFYTFESSNILSGDPMAWIYNREYIVIASDDNGGSELGFKLTYHLVAGQNYYFAAGCYNLGIGKYDVILTNTNDVSSIAMLDIVLGDTSDVSFTKVQQNTVYKIIPTTTGNYLFHSSSANGDPIAWLYDSTLTNLKSDDSSATGLNFAMVHRLIANQTYYFVAGHNSLANISFNLSVYLPASIPSDTYYIQNSTTLQYVDIHGPYEQEFIHQWTFANTLQSKWDIQRQSDGYYTIRSKFGQKKYIGVANTNVAENNIKLYNGIENKTKWQIFCLQDGKMIFAPKTDQTKALYATSDICGSELRLVKLAAPVSDRDKWRFNVKLPIICEGQQMEKWCWAACARMLVNHYYAVPAERDQKYAVDVVKNNTDPDLVIDQTGTLDEIIQATGVYRSNDKNSTELGIVKKKNQIYGKQTLKRIINDNHPVLTVRLDYTNHQLINGSHVSVVVGYQSFFKNGNLDFHFVICDPMADEVPSQWNEPFSHEGQTFTRSYSGICYGENGETNDGKHDRGLWIHSLIVDPTNLYETIDPVKNVFG